MMKVKMKISGAFRTLAETLRVLLFMTLAIVVFKFYPLTAIMIVMLALLNDGAILSIAYDNVIYRNKPEAWDTVLGISTVLGVVGVIAAFSLFYLGERVFHLDRAHIQTLMYLKLFGGRSSDDFPDVHARSFLVHTPRQNHPRWRWSTHRSVSPRSARSAMSMRGGTSRVKCRPTCRRCRRSTTRWWRL